MTLLQPDPATFEVVTAGGDGQVTIHDFQLHTALASFRGDSSNISAMCSRPQTTQFLTASTTARIRLWDSRARNHSYEVAEEYRE